MSIVLELGEGIERSSVTGGHCAHTAGDARGKPSALEEYLQCELDRAAALEEGHR
jgi:hypothetical protein